VKDKVRKDSALHTDALMDAAEVCRILNISRKTLYNYTHPYKDRPVLLSSIRHRGKTMFRPQTIAAYQSGHEFRGVYKRSNQLATHIRRTKRRVRRAA
jgi:hypothetical protein